MCLPPPRVTRPKSFHSFHPKGWPKAFVVEYSYHPRYGKYPAHCEIETIMCGGEEVSDWVDNMGIDVEKLEAEALTQVRGVTYEL